MQISTLVFASTFALIHLVLFAPFVAVDHVVPSALGSLSLSCMALTLVLAARWRLVDHVMGGPDKSYLAHRWLGLLALAGAMGHWAMDALDGAGLIPFLSESGEGAGTIAALGLIWMTAAALVRAIPYHLWKLSHMLMGPIFALAAYHALLVTSPQSIGATPWAVMAVMSVVGLVGWGQTLLRKRNPARRVTVSRVSRFEGGVDITLTSETEMPPFRPGQFATLAHNRARAEAHPFTIAGGDALTRRFVIRAAGDWTSAFVRNLAEGDTLRLSGGYGRFLPQVGPRRPEQLWVAGGVGITPFLAALEKMEPDSNARVTLIYCIRSRETAGVLDAVEAHAARLPQLALNVVAEANAKRDFTVRLAEIIREMSGTSQAYLCGPEGLKHLVETTWNAQGKTGTIHSERFDFRGAYSLADVIYVGTPLMKTARSLTKTKVRMANAPAGS